MGKNLFGKEKTWASQEAAPAPDITLEALSRAKAILEANDLRAPLLACGLTMAELATVRVKCLELAVGADIASTQERAAIYESWALRPAAGQPVGDCPSEAD